MKELYPVLFTFTEECILVEVPDLEVLTEGKDMLNAVEMARDAIELKGITLEDEKIPMPKPTRLEDIDVTNGEFSQDGKTIVSLVDIDTTEYRRKVDNRTVRKNVSLPSWLNYKAEEAGINVSRVLQDALIQKLGLDVRG